MLPHIVVYTDDLPEHVGGRANAFFIRIKKKYESDKGLLAHELIHVEQWWRFAAIGIATALILFASNETYADWLALAAFVLGVNWHHLRYSTSKQYRLNAELEAYSEQLDYSASPEAAANVFSEYIANNYNLDISANDALKLLDLRQRDATRY